MISKKLIFAFIFFSFFIFPLFSFAQTTDQSALIQQLQRQVEELRRQVQTLQQQLTETRSELGVTAPIPQTTEQVAIEPETVFPDFTRTLSRGSSGDDVRKLQEFLKKDKEIYPEGLITGYFGPKTEEALKRWQEKHNIEAVGILGPQTRARFSELGKVVIQGLLQQGAGASGIIPPGLQIAPGIEKKITIATTTQATSTPPQSQEDLCPKDPTKCYIEKTCKAQNFYWYNVSCHKDPPISGSCAASNAFCINSNECSKGGFYWCRNSCYATSTACLGEVFTPPAQPPAPPVVPATPAIPATPAQPTSQTSTTTVQATPATPAVPAIITTTTTPLHGSSLNLSGVTNIFGKIWDTGNRMTLGGGLRGGTQIGTGYAYQYDGKYVASYSIKSASSDYLTQTGPVNILIYGLAGSIIEVWDLENLTVIATNVGSPGSPIMFTAQPNHRYGGFDWHADNSQKDTEIRVSLSLASSITDIIIPAVQPILSATPSADSIALKWYRAWDNIGVVGYIIYRNGTQISSFATSTSLVFITDFGLTPSTSYSYTVAAYDTAGNVSAQSSAISATTLAVQTTPADTTPPVISNVQVNAAPTSATITWTTDELSDSQVSYAISGVASFQSPLDTTLTKNHTVTIADLYASTFYYYLLAESRDSSGNYKYYYYNGFDTPPLLAPTGLVATLSGTNNVYISWNAVAGVRNYRLYRRLAGGTAWTMLTDGYQPTNFTNTAISAGTYEYKVNACDIASPPHCSIDSNYFSINIAVTTATTTSSINQNTASRLAQILESLNGILNSLKLLR